MPPTATEYDAVRREAIGQADPSDLLAESDIAYFWDAGGGSSILLTAALCCDMLAVRVGGTQIGRWSADGQSIDRTTQPAALRSRAAELRRRYLAGGSGLAASVAVQGIWAENPDAFDTDDDDEFV